MKPRVTTRRLRILVNVAVVAAIIALGVTIWSIHDSRPLPLVVGMMVGQGLGTLALAAFLFVVVVDLVRHRVIGPKADMGQSVPPPEDREETRSGDGQEGT